MARAHTLFLPTIVLDRGASSPLHQQLRRQLAGAIASGVANGMRMPSTRALARLLGISRNTVLAAYDELMAEGLIEGRRGSCMCVAAQSRRAASPFDLRRLLREAHYPAHTVSVIDQDGTPLYLTF